MSVAKSLELSVREDSTFRRIRNRLPTYLADIREDPHFLPMFLFARTMPGRRLHWRKATANAQPKPRGPSMFLDNAGDLVAALRQDGLTPALCLPPAVTAAIRAFAEATPCFGNHDRSLDLLPAEHVARQSKAAPVTSGHYFERVNGCDDLMKVQADPLLHDVASGYLGPCARVISTRLWWSFPPAEAPSLDAARQREMLHFDLDDWRMLKFFFYLTPVDADAGPHLYMRGTHRHHSLRHQLSLTVSRPLDEVQETYGADKLTSIHGSAGSGFAEDPFGFHAGSLARTTPRLMLEVGFGVTAPNRRRFHGEQVVRHPASAGSSRYARPPASAHALHAPATAGTPRSSPS